MIKENIILLLFYVVMPLIKKCLHLRYHTDLLLDTGLYILKGQSPRWACDLGKTKKNSRNSFFNDIFQVTNFS